MIGAPRPAIIGPSDFAGYYYTVDKGAPFSENVPIPVRMPFASGDSQRQVQIVPGGEP